MNKKGAALIISLLLVAVLAVLSSALYSKSINENHLARRYVDTIRAFWLAEAGIAEGLKNLPDDTSGYINQSIYTYNVTTTALAGPYYQIESTGAVAYNGGSVSRTIRAIVKITLPDPLNFEHAIESTGSLVTKGDAYTIDGTVNENAALNFTDMFGVTKEEVRSAADHLYDESSFASPVDNITWVDDAFPGIELIISGDLVGSGMLVVEGDVNISGTVDFDGIIYVIGTLSMSGTPTINGSILAESAVDIDTTIVGHVTVTYDTAAISAALSELSFASTDVVSWSED